MQRAYYFPLAVRATTLHRVCTSGADVWGGGQDDWGHDARLSSIEFLAALRSALRTHLTRPPTFAADTSLVDATVQALTAAALHHCEQEGGGAASLSPGVLRRTELEERLRAPAPPKRDAATTAHNVTAALLRRPGLRAPALSRAYGLMRRGAVAEPEWEALLLHHPPRELDEVRSAEQFKRLMAVLEAERRVLDAAPESGAVRQYVEYHRRAEEVTVRLPEQLREAEELAVLCLWAGSTHCTQPLHDKPAMRVCADELRRAADSARGAQRDQRKLAARLSPPVLAALRDDAARVRHEAEQLYCSVASDVAAELVYDLAPRLTELRALRRRATVVSEYQSLLGVAAGDFSMLDLTAAALRAVNYEEGDPAKQQDGEEREPPTTSVPLPAAVPVEGRHPAAGVPLRGGAEKDRDELLMFGTLCSDTDALTAEQRSRLYHNELFHRA